MLDLRYKMKLIEFYFPLLYGDESNIHIERVHMRDPTSTKHGGETWAIRGDKP